MYKKPRLERFGTLRELTLGGLVGDGDAATHGWGFVISSSVVDNGRS